MTHRSQGSWVTCHWEEAKVEEARDGHKRHGKSAWRSLSKQGQSNLLYKLAKLTTPLSFLATAHTKTHHTADHSTSPRYSFYLSTPLPIILSYSISYSIALLSFYSICTVCDICNRRHFWSHCFCPPFPVLFRTYAIQYDSTPWDATCLTARCISDAYQWYSLRKIFVAKLL